MVAYCRDYLEIHSTPASTGIRCKAKRRCTCWLAFMEPRLRHSEPGARCRCIEIIVMDAAQSTTGLGGWPGGYGRLGNWKPKYDCSTPTPKSPRTTSTCRF